MNTTRMVGIAVAAALAGGMAASAGAQSSSANFKLVQRTLNNGVGSMSSANYKLSSSLGDALFSGPLTSTNYKLSHKLSPGFWFGGSAAAPLFMNAVSRKVHGSAGTFNLPLAP
jgi:hypothetical protein